MCVSPFTNSKKCNWSGFIGCTLIKNSCEKPDYIINMVVPPYEIEDKDWLLENCFVNCLEIANENHIHSIAFPLLSTGTHGYPTTNITSN